MGLGGNSMRIENFQGLYICQYLFLTLKLKTMKKPFIKLSIAILIGLMINSCVKEETLNDVNLSEQTDQLEFRDDAVPPPDLIIETYFTDISFESTLCTDTIMPTTHCDFGDGARTFNAFVLIRNIGTGTLPAGEIDVQWTDSRNPDDSFTTIFHTGLAPQGTVIASRSYYVGPCDCAPIPGPESCFIHSYGASVDPFNEIPESMEFNNASEIYNTCDGCGPCELSQPTPL